MIAGRSRSPTVTICESRRPEYKTRTSFCCRATATVSNTLFASNSEMTQRMKRFKGRDELMRSPSILITFGAFMAITAIAVGQESRPRARDLGLAPGVFEPGHLNAITDVAGVSVGHATLNQG